jgi:hypothetical protein
MGGISFRTAERNCRSSDGVKKLEQRLVGLANVGRPLAAHGQQPTPVIGFLNGASPFLGTAESGEGFPLAPKLRKPLPECR